MNDRRPTDAAGESWRKWGARSEDDPYHFGEPVDRRPLEDDDGPYWLGFYRGTMAQPIWQRIVLAIAATLFAGFLIGIAVGRSWVV